MKKSPFIRRLLPLLLLTGFMACSARSDTIVHWGGSYVTSYTPLEGGPVSSTPGSSIWRYSDTIPKSPGYSGGPRFYGAFSLQYSGGTGTPAFRDELFGIAVAGANVSSLRFSAAPLSGEAITMRGAVFFKKEDFLSGEATGKVTFTSTSTITLTSGSSIGSTRQVSALVYALVGSEWSWYIAEQAKNGSIDITDAAAQKWAPYILDDDGLTALPGRPSSSSYTMTGAAFEDIGAVGFFFNYGQSETHTSLYVSSFAVNAHVEAIPEPATTAFLTLGGVTALLLKSRFRINR